VIRIDGTRNQAGRPKYLYTLVVVKDARLDDTSEKMELTFSHAERYKQTARYDGVYYYDQRLTEKGQYISIAEELPLTALLEPHFDKALYRFLVSQGREYADFLDELAARGCKLYVNYGRTDDFIVIARNVTVSDVGA
jgi:hypothetical protein